MGPLGSRTGIPRDPRDTPLDTGSSTVTNSAPVLSYTEAAPVFVL